MVRINTELGTDEVALLAEVAADMKVNKLKRKQGCTIIGVAIGLLTAITIIDILNGQAGDTIVNIVAIAIFIAFIALFRRYQVWRLEKYYAKMVAENTFPPQREYNIGEDAIKVMTEGVESTFKWNRIDRCQQKDHFYLLHTSMESAMIIDVNKLSAQDKAELDELLGKKGLL